MQIKCSWRHWLSSNQFYNKLSQSCLQSILSLQSQWMQLIAHAHWVVVLRTSFLFFLESCCQLFVSELYNETEKPVWFSFGTTVADNLDDNTSSKQHQYSLTLPCDQHLRQQYLEPAININIKMANNNVDHTANQLTELNVKNDPKVCIYWYPQCYISFEFRRIRQVIQARLIVCTYPFT